MAVTAVASGASVADQVSASAGTGAGPMPAVITASAPLASAPLASAPLASAPLASAPLASAPLASAPLASAPLASAPLASAPLASAPLVTARPSAEGTWVTLPMGDLSQPDNTFWQAFLLPSGGRRWVLRTPPGVAANGGLVLSAGGQVVAIGFLPSNLLSFSPLAILKEGKSSGQGLVPVGLAHSPDALSVGPDGRAAAIGGGVVLASRAATTGWLTLVSDRTLASSPVDSSCRMGEPSAVTVTTGATYVAVACAHPGVIGIVRVDGSPGSPSLHLVGPRLPGVEPSARVSVLRLVSYHSGTAALLELRQGARTFYLAAWDPSGSAAWSLSPAWSSMGQLKSVAVTSRIGFAVLVATKLRLLSAALIEPGSSAWSVLPAPPPATSTLAVTAGRIDALGGDGSEFVDDVLQGNRWDQTQIVKVAIPYGSTG